MNIALCIMAGALVGWAGYSFLEFQHGGGKIFSVVLGALAGAVGGKLVAPVFIAASTPPGAFSLSTVLIATAVAATLLFVGSFVYRSWGGS